MRHRLQHKLFDRKKRSKSRSPSTFINMLHSKSTYFYRWESKHLSGLSYVVPSACGLALVLVLGLSLFPTIDGNTTSVYAESGIAPMSVSPDSEANISLIMGATSGEFNPADTTATTVTADEVTFRPYKFQVRYAETSQYAVQLNSANGYGNNLRGRDNPEAVITGVGTNKKPAEFGNNTWGFALEKNSTGGDNIAGTDDYTQYKYSTVPEYSTQTGQNTKIVDVKVDADKNQTEAQTDDWTLAFAAKIGSNSPADHYISRVYLSVVRTPERIYTVTYNANKPEEAEGEVTGLFNLSNKFADSGKDSIYKLSTDVLKLKKYTFLGWSTTQHTAFSRADKTAAIAAVQYKVGSNIDLSDFSVNQADINLYAVWLLGGGLLDIDTMQGMTSDICNSEDTKVGDTKRLQDTRDGNYYWVAKLKDGNCWMTQNLDYNIPANRILRAVDTNVASDITLPAVTAVNNSTSNGVAAWSMTTESNQQNKGYNVLAYYDPGLMLKTNPATVDSCSNDTNVIKLNDSACVSKGWKDVSNGYTPKTDAPQNDLGSATSTTANVLDGTTYDAHYLSGNYYSWALATANAAWNITAGGTQASGSICPKGWKLPTSSTSLSQYPTLTAGNLNSYDVSGSFAYLFRQYGLATSANGGTVTAGGYNAYDAPLYYLRSGVIDSQRHQNTSLQPRGFINYAGDLGRYWSSVVYSNNVAYDLLFGSSIQSSDYVPRHYGATIRCVHDPAIAE